MTTEQVTLRQGHLVGRAVGDFGGISTYVSPEGDAEVQIFVDADGEHEYWLRPGDTFPVCNQTWKLDRIENPEDKHWTALLVRVA